MDIEKNDFSIESPVLLTTETVVLARPWQEPKMTMLLCKNVAGGVDLTTEGNDGNFS